MTTIIVSELKERIAQLEEQREQAVANANALYGAIQDCEYWLSKLLEPEKTENKDSPV